ncbi:MAG: HDOD domain-containing protein, partial [Planctomycetales bacterium]|nr:HDOD domain-containing protein [Planctomycetales bacterium]
MPIDPATIWTSTQLPSLPTVAVRLLELSGCPDTPISDVVATVKTDPAICGRIMKAANSAHVGLRSPVSSIERAVMCLGSNVITSLALSFTLVDQNKAPKALRGIYDSFWLQSLIRASTAELLARELPRADKCELFLSGLLVHVGQLAMIKTIPEEYAPVLQEYQENNQSLCELETARFGFSHVEVGQRLMEGWRLPTALIDAVRLHHAGVDEVLELRQMPQFDVVAATCIAGLVAEHFEGRMHCGVWERLIQYSDQLLAFDDTKLEAFIVAVSEATEDVGKMLDINTDSMLDPGELMSRANSQLSEMALQAHAVSTQALAINAELERTNHELVSQNLELRERIMVDPLTRVYNRSFFDEYLMAEARRCLRQHQP